MVNITPEEVMAQRKAEREPELSDFDRKIIGGSVRIDVPMDSKGNLAKFGRILSELGESLQQLSRSQSMTPRQAMMEASFQCYSARRLILAISGDDKGTAGQRMRNRMVTKLQA
jgi:hypothetical protein